MEPSGDTYVYSLIRGRGEKRRIVYIGITKDPIERVARHFSSKTKKFTSMNLMKSFSDRAEAEKFERRAIDLLEPRFNVLILDSSDVGEIYDEEIHILCPVVQRDLRKYPIRRALVRKEGTTRPVIDTSDNNMIGLTYG